MIRNIQRFFASLAVNFKNPDIPMRLKFYLLPTKALLFAVVLFPIRLLAQDHFADDIHLRGLLNNKLKIEVLLETDEARPFFSNTSKTCIDIQGTYYYRTQVLPIRVEGRLCPANSAFFLTAKDGETETERFEGKWNTATKQLTGTWTLKKTNKTMPFTLTALEAGIKENSLKGFYGVLQELLSSEPDAEGARIDDATWTSEGGKVIGFTPNWGGDMEFLAPTRLEYYTSYTSTARSSYYEGTFQLLPSTSGIYVAHLSTNSGFEKSYEGDEETGDGASHCGFDFHVYQWVEERADDVTSKVVPADIAEELEEGEQEACKGYLISEAVLLPSGEKLYWNGNKFERSAK
jgi:hypothetical protein